MDEIRLLGVRLIARLATLAVLFFLVVATSIEVRWSWEVRGHFYQVTLRVPYGKECVPEPMVRECLDRLRMSVYVTRGPGGVCAAVWVQRSSRTAHESFCLGYRDLGQLMRIE